MAAQDHVIDQRFETQAPKGVNTFI